MKKLLQSFGYAFAGIFRTIRTERNMRIHLTFTAYMFGFLTIYDFFEVSRTQFAILFLTCALVTAAELVNTAVENVVDLVEQKKNDYCKIAKDAAAGAVLVCALFSVAVGLAILLQPAAFRAMFAYYREKPVMLIVLALSVAVSCLFIFLPGRGKGKTE